ncbi:chromate transporter [Oscillospiraceae bacterium PP1C4]
MKKSAQCLTLFLTFLKIGAFTFGGGYAMISLIQRETAETHHWMTDRDVVDMIAIAQSVPGAIAVNSATFVGYRVAGFWGALCATLGVVLPSFVIISIISVFIMQYRQIEWLAWIFDGIRAGVIVLVLDAVLKLKKTNDKSLFNLLVMLLAFFGASFIKVDVVLFVILAAIVGIVRQLILIRKTEYKGGSGND